MGFLETSPVPVCYRVSLAIWHTESDAIRFQTLQDYFEMQSHRCVWMNPIKDSVSYSVSSSSHPAGRPGQDFPDLKLWKAEETNVTVLSMLINYQVTSGGCLLQKILQLRMEPKHKQINLYLTEM